MYSRSRLSPEIARRDVLLHIGSPDGRRTAVDCVVCDSRSFLVQKHLLFFVFVSGFDGSLFRVRRHVVLFLWVYRVRDGDRRQCRSVQHVAVAESAGNDDRRRRPSDVFAAAELPIGRLHVARTVLWHNLDHGAETSDVLWVAVLGYSTAVRVVLLVAPLHQPDSRGLHDHLACVSRPSATKA